MKFDKPTGENPINQLKVVSHPYDHINRPLKTTSTAHYTYKWHEESPNTTYGYIISSTMAKGHLTTLDTDTTQKAPGILAVITTSNTRALSKGNKNTTRLLGSPTIEHYHQAIALVVAKTFKQAQAAASLVQAHYHHNKGAYSLADKKQAISQPPEDTPNKNISDFDRAFTSTTVKIDATYTTPDQSHMAMEPHASMAIWDGNKLTLWTSNQMIDWCHTNLAKTLKVPMENVHIISPYISRGFGSKLFLRSNALLAALTTQAVKHPVKVMLPHPTIPNNTTHHPTTLQHLHISANQSRKITAISHESWSRNLPSSTPETAVQQSKLLYTRANHHTSLQLTTLDLPEGNTMHAPSKAPSLMALKITINKLAEKAGINPIKFHILNDTQVDPTNPTRHFSHHQLIKCLHTRADKFGWKQHNTTPRQVHNREWLVSHSITAGFHNNLLEKSGAQVHLKPNSTITMETDMTNIGTSSYTILAQTAAEMLGIPLEQVAVHLSNSSFPVSAGSGGQWGTNTSTSSIYTTCVKLHEMIASAVRFDPEQSQFANSKITNSTQSTMLHEATTGSRLIAEESIEFRTLSKEYQQSTFARHFVEVSMHSTTGEVQVQHMLTVCAAGHILNPKTAHSQVIGTMTMGMGTALMEELAVDDHLGYFINHNMAGYEVPVHADIPKQEVIFLDDTNPISSPMKAKGVSELGLCSMSTAITNTVYNTTSIQVQDYPITLDKLLNKLPDVV